MAPCNRTVQMEEVEAVSAIYGCEWAPRGEGEYHVRICEGGVRVALTLALPEGYPAHEPPRFTLCAPFLDRSRYLQLQQALHDVSRENIGGVVIYQWVEKIREVLRTIKPKKGKEQTKGKDNTQKKLESTKCPAITHSEVITDRKSSFQAHAAKVHSLEDVKAVLAKLKENKKISNAKHNVVAYRIEKRTERGVALLQDSDDDGEKQAGGRVMHLLQRADARNTLVVVTRWFGGIQIGADRFKHYNNAARVAMIDAGLIKK